MLPGRVEHQRTAGLLHGTSAGWLSRSHRDRDVSGHVARLFLSTDYCLLVRAVHLQPWSAGPALRRMQWATPGDAGMVLRRSAGDSSALSFCHSQPRQRLQHGEHGLSSVRL